jgi:hypothetical protein
VGVVRHSNIKRRTSALGHKRTLPRVFVMSALPPKADIDHDGGNVCFVPRTEFVEAVMSWRVGPMEVRIDDIAIYHLNLPAPRGEHGLNVIVTPRNSAAAVHAGQHFAPVAHSATRCGFARSGDLLEPFGGCLLLLRVIPNDGVLLGFSMLATMPKSQVAEPEPRKRP